MIYVLAIFILMGLTELRPLFKKGAKKDKIVVVSLYCIVLTICILMSFNVEIPSFLVGAGNLVKALGLSYPPLK